MIRWTGVWLATGTVLAAAVGWLGSDAAALVDAATWQGPFDRLLVDLSAAVVLACLTWLWAVTTLTGAELLAGASPAELARRGGATRRLVLALCGAAAIAQLTQPAVAAEQGPGPRGDRPAGVARLAGLSLPDRATLDRATLDRATLDRANLDRGAPSATARPASAATSADVVVTPGDSLWAVAEDALGATGQTDPDLAEIDAYWRAIHTANRDVVGDDPDLIHPGQHLRLPDPDTTTAHSEEQR